jgi:translation initiation factor 5B
MRSIITCIVGHVDSGKTSLSDTLRGTHVQKQEVGGITQKIGGTTFDKESLKKMMGSLYKKEPQIDGLLLLDTPGHNCYTNMRVTGMEASDIVIVVVDINKGLEKETINCLEILENKKVPYVIALNKLDKIYGYRINENHINLQKSFKLQDKQIMDYLKSLSNNIICQLANIGDGINASLYYENNNIKDFISMVPISAKTGVGIPDLTMLLVSLAEKTSILKKKLTLQANNRGYIIENMRDSKLGNGYMAILCDGEIKKNNKIVCLNNNNEIKTYDIKELYLPEEGTETKNKINVVHYINDTIKASNIIFIKIDDSDTLMNSSLFYITENEFTEDILLYMKQYNEQKNDYIKLKIQKEGVYFCVPSMGMLYACINFANINISGYSLGTITKADIIKAKYKGTDILEDEIYNKKYSVILNYQSEDNISGEIKEYAKSNNVKIISNELIHKLFEDYDKYKDSIYEEIKCKHPNIILPFKLNILPQYVFRKNNPIIIGIKVSSGNIKKGNMIQIKDNYIGKIMTIQKNKKEVEIAKLNDEVCISIDSKLKYDDDFNSNDIFETYYSDDDKQLINRYTDVFKI